MSIPNSGQKPGPIRLQYLRFCCLLFLCCLFAKPSTAQLTNNPPNILLIIADDMGVDVSNGYHSGGLMPVTPTLDSLRTVGLTFENVWSAPVCTPTRAAIMSGKYGVKTGVLKAPGNLDTSHVSVFRALENQSNKQYADAVVGKWHISQPTNPLHANLHGADYFMGVMGAGVTAYDSWEKTEFGLTATDTNYVTTNFTDTGLAWIEGQAQPWFLWLAHVTPHTPIHVPPSHMFSIPATGTTFRKYISMIESFDFEVGRLLNDLPDSVKSNTLVIILGDNGTPNNLLRDYPANHGKGSLYQGGIRVPMIVAGVGVSRMGERENALIHVNDIYATILELAGADLPGGRYNSLSFSHLLEGSPGATRDYNYSEIDFGWTIRSPQYKLIEYTDGSQEFFDLVADSLEFDNLLISGLTATQQENKDDLEIEAAQIRTAWSCRDHIQNGDEEGIDCGGSYCDPCSSSSLEQIAKGHTISVYPNPGRDQLNIVSKKGLLDEIRIFNSMGELLLSESGINAPNKTLSINHLGPQVYFVQIRSGEKIELVRLVKI